MTAPAQRRLRSTALFQLTRARVLEFLREPEALFWVFIFPLLLALALGVAFRNQGPTPIPVGVEVGSGSEGRLAALAASERIEGQPVDREIGRRELATGKLALVVLDTEPPTYWFDPTRPDSRLARLEVDDTLQRAAGRRDAIAPAELEMTERGSRYIDFLVPGLLGMNLMGTGLWSIGFSLVQQRVGKLLKLFVAAPTRRWQLLASYVLARFVFLTLEVTLLVAFAVAVLEVPLRGSVGALAAVAVLGALAFVGLGLLVASRAKTIEGVSGLMNFTMFPMWVFSGIFFSYERFPEVVQPAIRALPLTALNDGLRGVMLEGASLAALVPELAVLTAWGGACFALALKLFRWQ